MKAVGLFSGGLDSLLSAALMTHLGVEVHAVYFRQPWLEKDPQKVREFASQVDMHFHVVDLGQDYLDMLQSPRYGYGKAFNPCIDCHRFMVMKAGEVMKEVGASFVFTGEVLGQRPMSQHRQSLDLVEKGTGLEGYLLRPLSAKFMEETIPEQKGWVDRQQLFGISGRSRREQKRLAKELGVEEFFPTGGGCLITEIPFGRRMKDFLTWPYRSPEETAVLKGGRYFRLNKDAIAVLGRNKIESEFLMAQAYPDDYVGMIAEHPGPLLLLKGKAKDLFSLAGGLIQQYSKLRAEEPQKISWMKGGREDQREYVMARKVSEEELKTLAR